MSGASTLTYTERFSIAMSNAKREFAEVSEFCDHFAARAKELEAENAKLRELAENLLMAFVYLETEEEQKKCIDRALELREELGVLPMEHFDACELGIEEYVS